MFANGWIYAINTFAYIWIMTIHERIKQIATTEDLSIAAFEKEIGVNQNSLSASLRRESSISHEVIAKISKRFPNYSLNWLVLGKQQSPKEELLDKVKKLVNGK